MDDICQAQKKKLETLIQTIRIYSQSVVMECGIVPCL